MTEFKGTGIALVTPMNEDCTLDFVGLSRLVEHTISGHADFLVILGTTGESPTVYPEERIEIIDNIVKFNNSRLPLVLGFSGNFTDNLVKKLKDLKDERLDGVLISSPHYNKPSQEGIFQHYKAVAEVSHYPIVIYNVPHRTSSNMTAETILRLAEIENIVAIKEASGNLEQCQKIIEKRPKGFQVLSGDDLDTANIIRMGGDGVISVVANAFPKQMADLVNHELAGNQYENPLFEKAMALCCEEGNPTSIKAALSALKICQKHVRLPLTPPSNNLIQRFEKLKMG